MLLVSFFFGHSTDTRWFNCGHGTCRYLVRGNLRRTNNGNPWKSTAIATSALVETAGAISTAIGGHCLDNAAITTEVSESPRKSAKLAREFPRTSNRRKFHGHPRTPATIAVPSLCCHYVEIMSNGFKSNLMRSLFEQSIRTNKIC